MSIEDLSLIVEAVIFASPDPVTLEQLLAVFAEDQQPDRQDLKNAITHLQEKYQDRSFELVQVASGYRFQVKQDYANYLQNLWSKKPQRMSRALVETLALVAYQQPISRGEIEAVRGVVVSTNIMKTLLERNWVKVVGYKDVPGKPALYGTTKEFLDYFNLKSLSQLPELPPLADLETMAKEIDAQLGVPQMQGSLLADDEDEAINAHESDSMQDDDGINNESAAEDLSLTTHTETETHPPQHE